MPYPTLVDEIQGHNVLKLDLQEGHSFVIGDNMRVTWKAEGKDTGYVFSCYEFPWRQEGAFHCTSIRMPNSFTLSRAGSTFRDGVIRVSRSG